MNDSSNATTKQIADHLDRHIRARPHLAERIHRELLMELHRRGIVTIDRLQDEAHQRAGLSARPNLEDPNQTERARWDENEKLAVEEVTREYVCNHFTIPDIDDLVNLTLKRDEVHNLENVATMANVSFRELADKIKRFCDLPLGETQLVPAEVVGTRVALIRHLVSDQLEYIGIAKNFLHIRDFNDICQRTIGSDSGMGRVGGKAGGMILADAVLRANELPEDVLAFPVKTPDSWFLRSDVVEDFIRLNRLDEYQAQKYKPTDDLVREFPLIRGIFRNGDFPLKIVHDLRRILQEIGDAPLIVRSSSLLEDRFGTAFCGKYASFFLANQGTLEERLSALLGGIAEVYASTLAPDPILYRRAHDLIDYVEEMAVLIQKVVGTRLGDYFLPAFAGVAFSRNEYRWAPRIKREDGLMRIVMGLGTRAVDRSGADYPRMVALGAPTLRPESTVQEILRSSQKTLDVINLKTNKLESVKYVDLLRAGYDIPLLPKMVSVYRDGELYPPAGVMIDAEPEELCLTFDNLIRDTKIDEQVKAMLDMLEKAYGTPVDMEFACDGENFYLLQCRTQSQALESGPVDIPKDVPSRNVIFDAKKFVRSGWIDGVEYVVYIPAESYFAVEKRQDRIAIARLIGRVNRALEKKSFILIGPGRWGSNDILLGVPVSYADINKTKMLIEVARERDGFVPEVSFGTHFFQDLVESGIHYLPLYPDQEGIRFNEDFLQNSPNELAKLLPKDADYQEQVRVINVPAAMSGKTITIAMNGDTDEALAFLE